MKKADFYNVFPLEGNLRTTVKTIYRHKVLGVEGTYIANLTF